MGFEARVWQNMVWETPVTRYWKDMHRKAYAIPAEKVCREH